LQFETTLAENGLIAFDYVYSTLQKHNEMFDLVFLDLNMPICDGFEASELINSLFDNKKNFEINK